MAKKLFRNYEFEFDKNERKILVTFCKQFVNQLEGDNKYFREIKTFNSIIEKLNSTDGKIKFTKEEKTKLVLQLRENTKHIEQQMLKSWFIKKWLLKSMFKQYSNLLDNKFSE